MRTSALETQLSLDQAMERDASGEWTDAVRFKLRQWQLLTQSDREPFEFTSDDLRWACGDPPGTGNILGALLSQEVRAGRLEVVGRRKSTRPGRHRARLNVYRGRS